MHVAIHFNCCILRGCSRSCSRRHSMRGKSSSARAPGTLARCPLLKPTVSLRPNVHSQRHSSLWTQPLQVAGKQFSVAVNQLVFTLTLRHPLTSSRSCCGAIVRDSQVIFALDPPYIVCFPSCFHMSFLPQCEKLDHRHW